MLRIVLFALFIISFSACNSEQESRVEKHEVQENPSEEPFFNLVPHNNLANQNVISASENDCSATEPLYLSDRITDLNKISQQMFALEGKGGVNGYANFITLAQLATITNADTSDVIEQIGLFGVTENEEWINVFCYLEAITPTNDVQINLAKNWLIRDDFYEIFARKFSANFTSKEIDVEQDLWRASIRNNWLIDLQLTINNEQTRYVNYQTSPDAEGGVAHAITVTDTINTISNEFGDYYSINNNSNYTVHIIMPTFDQYSYVKNNIVDVLDEYRELEKTQQVELSLPYFSQAKLSESFIGFSGWLDDNWAGEIFDEENQDFSGINQYETFKLINTGNSNSFDFNSTGTIRSQYHNTNTLEAIFFVEQSHNSSAGFVSTGSGNLPLNCNEVEVENLWRPYFMIIENTANHLIYSIIANGQPEFRVRSNFCNVLINDNSDVIEIPLP